MEMIPLFRLYPRLHEKLPYVSLGEFPTPVRKLDKLGKTLGLDRLFLKDDGYSGEIYGGNKVRKLEFLLGQIANTKAKEILTFGYAGSNHTLATTIYAKQLGVKCILMLLPQSNAQYVRDNLLMSHYWGGELRPYRNTLILVGSSLFQLLSRRIRHRVFPHVIPPGGTSPLGVVGYVSAALELKEQILAGSIPEPDRVYVALGTMGTAVGLMLGLNAAGLKTRVTAVRIAESGLLTVKRAIRLLHRSNSLLWSLDSSFPNCTCTEADIEIRDEFMGLGYARFTEQGMDAVRQMKELEGIELEGTYTGKTLAALIDDARKGAIGSETILFWNTSNARKLSALIASVDYHQLPRPLHRYFEVEVQPLDRSFGRVSAV